MAVLPSHRNPMRICGNITLGDDAARIAEPALLFESSLDLRVNVLSLAKQICYLNVEHQKCLATFILSQCRP